MTDNHSTNPSDVSSYDALNDGFRRVRGGVCCCWLLLLLLLLLLLSLLVAEVS